MRIHADHLPASALYAAASRAGVSIDKLQETGSKTRRRAFTVLLAGNGRTGSRWGNSGTHGAAERQAATWDEWGMFLADLFRADLSTTVPGVYETGEHFRYVTDFRFDSLTPDQAHHYHRWDRAQSLRVGDVVDTPCKGTKARPCTAVRREFRRGLKWHDLAGV